MEVEDESDDPEEFKDTIFAAAHTQDAAAAPIQDESPMITAHQDEKQDNTRDIRNEFRMSTNIEKKTIDMDQHFQNAYITSLPPGHSE